MITLKLFHSVFLAVLFFFGIVISIRSRLKFEKKKDEYDAKYISLFREHNTVMILLFVALLIIMMENIL